MFEKISNIYSIVLNLVGILIGLFSYVKRPRRQWIFVIGFLLCTLLSNYYWGIYVLVMEDDPNVSSVLAYFGWNASFFILAVMHLLFRTPEEKKSFSPLALLPLPLNIIQFIIWLPYGGIFNSIWQGLLSTLTACLALNSVIFYIKKKKERAVPYVAFASLFFITMEYVMWTASCFDWPSEWLNLYNYASILDYLYYILLPVSMILTYGDHKKKSDEEDPSFLKFLNPIYAAFLFGCCLAGYLIALWMRNTLSESVDEAMETDPYRVIVVMLFVISVVILLVTVTVILMVGIAQKSREGRRFMEDKLIAEQANAAKSEFLANMSPRDPHAHECRAGDEQDDPARKPGRAG